MRIPPRSPLVTWAVLLVSSCGAGLSFPHPRAYVCAALAALLAALAGLCLKKNRGTAFVPFSAWLFTVLCGLCLGAHVGVVRERETAFLSDGARLRGPCVLEGRIDASRPGWHPGDPYVDLQLRDVSVGLPGGGAQPVRIVRAEVRCYHPPAFRNGEYWRFSARFQSLDGDTLRGPSPMIRLTCGAGAAAERLGKKAPWFHAAILALRTAVAGRLERGVVEKWPVEAALVRAMTLGLREDIPSDVRGFFRNSGTAHIFAISGLVVGLVALMLVYDLRFLPLRYDRWGVVLIPCLLFYTLLVGASPSACRAFCMLAFYWFAPLLGVRVTPLASISAAAVFLAGFDPANLLDAGFWMSFTVTAGIVVYAGGLHRLLVRASTPAAARELPPLSLPRGARLARRAREAVCSLAAVSLSAWVFSVPLGVWFFDQFVPVGMLANLIVVPMTFVVVLSGGLGLLAGLVWAPLSVFFNFIMVWCVHGMRLAAAFFASFPRNPVYFEWPLGLAGLVAAYAVLAAAGLWLHASQDGGDEETLCF